MNPLEVIKSYGVVPVLGLKNVSTAAKVAAALQEGGLPLIEVTLRDACALECLAEIKKAYPDMLVGAGTILNTEQVDKARAAGADFFVSPGFNPKVVGYCVSNDLPIVPGCVTPSEIEAALEMGLSVTKFFPSECMKGLETIKQLGGPYKDVKFIPTSGINFDNISQYLAYDGVAAVGGSFMAPAKLIEAEDWDAIVSLCRKAVECSLGFGLAHIGLNCGSPEKGLETAKWFMKCFGFPVAEGVKSTFAGSAVECCNIKFPGTNGHIAIATNSPERAEAYFRRNGIELRDEFRNEKNGKLVAVYLKDEICGFAVHIVKRK